MTRKLTNAVLAAALFCGSIAAGDMGNGGYTDCDGSNPPPDCLYSRAGNPKSDIDLTVVLNEIGHYFLEVF